MGLCLLVLCANCSFFVSKRAKEQFALEKEQIADSRSFLKSVGSDSLLDIKRGKQWKTYNKKSLVFWERLALITSESLTSFFFKEWRARFTHGRSFVKSNESDSLFFKEQQEWIAHGCSLKWSIFSKRAKSEWVKEWIPNPAQQWSFSHD